MDTARGIWLALTNGDLGPEWGDAIARVEEEAGEINYRLNAERMTARIKAKHGF